MCALKLQVDKFEYLCFITSDVNRWVCSLELAADKITKDQVGCGSTPVTCGGSERGSDGRSDRDCKDGECRYGEDCGLISEAKALLRGCCRKISGESTYPPESLKWSAILHLE